MADSGPVTPRQALGAALRLVRDVAGLSGPQLARRTGISQPKISRMEAGQHRPKLPDVETWLDACGVIGGERERIVEMAHDALTEVTGLRELLRGSISTRAREFLSMDAEIRRVRQFQPFIIPGIAHTEQYAAACITAANLTGEPDIESAVEYRMQRGDRFRAPDGPAYHMVVTEAALSFWPAVDDPATVVRAARRKLLETAQAANVRLQIIPAGTPMTALPQGSFSIFEWAEADEPPMVLMETPAAEVTYTDPDDLTAFEIVWQRMCADALDPDASLTYLQRLAEDI